MIRTTVTAPNGRKLVAIGLSGANLEKLAPHKDFPIHVEGEDLGVDFDVLIFSGKDERTMLAHLSEHFDVGEVREGDPPPPSTAPAPPGAGVDHGSLPPEAMQAAFKAAFDALAEHEIHSPALALIAQDDYQRRSFATNVDNPADLLRVVLWNIEKAGQGD